MKKMRLALMALGVVTCLGFTSIVSAPVAMAADEAATEDVDVYGAGTLTAHGDGIAVLGGTGVVRLSGNGILWIKDFSGNAVIEVSGYGQKQEFSDGWIQYAGFRGQASVKGRRIVVAVAGVDVDLYARGRGYVRLWGHGTYEINSQSGTWSIRPPALVNIASDDDA